jgi:hypothetical protein
MRFYSNTIISSFSVRLTQQLIAIENIFAAGSAIIIDLHNKASMNNSSAIWRMENRPLDF